MSRTSAKAASVCLIGQLKVLIGVGRDLFDDAAHSAHLGAAGIGQIARPVRPTAISCAVLFERCPTSASRHRGAIRDLHHLEVGLRRQS